MAFAHIAYACVIPFFFTTVLFELALALALLGGLLQPDPVLSWALGSGSCFTATYQLIAVIWIAALFVMAAWRTLERDSVARLFGGPLNFL